MKVSSSALKAVLAARGLDPASLSFRSGVPEASIDAAINHDGQLADSDISAMAEELAVPYEALFAKQPLPLFAAVDFRTAKPHIRKQRRGTLQAIGFVERISNTLVALRADVSLSKSLKPISTDYSDKDAIALAKSWRSKWGVTDDTQLDWKDSNKVYVSLRSFIEGLGIFVIHKSFDNDAAAGLYVHLDNGPHVVVINTTHSSKARKLFTLAHEFCHVLIRKEGASNPSVLNNNIERFCNKFAAYLLAPPTLINAGISRYGYTPSSSARFVRLFAKNLGISQEALVFRLVEEKLLTSADYSKWRSQFNGLIPPGDQSDGSGGKSDPLQTKRTTYGTALLGRLAAAHSTGLLDEIDIFRLCGLKPKYQAQLFSELRA